MNRHLVRANRSQININFSCLSGSFCIFTEKNKGSGDVAKGKKENLIPFNQRTEDERREIAKKAGIASGASRRAKKHGVKW